jgi:hypothetical protein
MDISRDQDSNSLTRFGTTRGSNSGVDWSHHRRCQDVSFLIHSRIWSGPNRQSSGLGLIL